MMMRVDTDPVLKKIEQNLKGVTTDYETDAQGNVVAVNRMTGRAKCNQEGVQSVLLWESIMIGPHTVQGNVDKDDFDIFLMHHNTDFLTQSMISLHEWNMNLADYHLVTGAVNNASHMFFSRAVDNKERESYAAVMRHVDTSKSGTSVGNDRGVSGLFR